MSKFKSVRKKIKKPKNSSANKFEQLRKKAAECFSMGAMSEAFRLQNSLIQDKDYGHKSNLKQKQIDYTLYVTILYHLAQYSEALVYAKKLVDIAPDNSGYWERLGTCYLHCHQLSEGINALEVANQKSEVDNANIWSALAHAFAKSNQLEKAKEAGNKALQLKSVHQEGLKTYPIPDCLPSVFNKDTAEKNIISFSLFGDKAEYCESAIINVREANVYYPSWQCRFYCDETVPENVRVRLINSGAEVVMMPIAERLTDGLFWRFLVMDDVNVDRFLIRDCDSVVNSREAAAVDEWIASNKYFHLMRDSFNHTELILAGMFGGVQGVIPDILGQITLFQSQTYSIQTHLDQDFLRKAVWPTLSQSLCAHDRCFGFYEAMPFPANSELPDDRQVGDNKFSSSINQVDAKEGTKFRWFLYDEEGLLICDYIEMVRNSCLDITVPFEYGEKISSQQFRIDVKLVKVK